MSIFTMKGGRYTSCRRYTPTVEESPSFSPPVSREGRGRQKVHGNGVLLEIRLHRITSHRIGRWVVQVRGIHKTVENRGTFQERGRKRETTVDRTRVTVPKVDS